MEFLLWTILICGLVSWLTKALPILWGIGQIPKIGSKVKGFSNGLPSLSVVLTACNEQENIEGCVRSLLLQRYPKLELIAIDDRSDDKTGTILDRMALEFPESLKVVHIRELPAGWIGKNYAMATGAKECCGDWILFCDGDVCFESGVLELALYHALDRNVEHLTLIPDLLHGSFWEGAIEACFTFALLRGVRFWKVDDPNSEDAMGIGAFNLFRRRAYQDFGGHEAIRLCVDDDEKIVEYFKKRGGKVAIANSNKMVKVRWQKGVWGIVKGMEKNAFAAFSFRIDLVVLVLSALFAVDIAPYLLIFLWHNPIAQSICAFEILLAVAVYLRIGKFFATPRIAGFFHPLLILLIAYTICNSTVVTLKNGGIRWRGTFYALKELKRFRPGK